MYFAHPPVAEEDEAGRLHMLYDMIYWLMSLNKEQVWIIFKFYFLFFVDRIRSKVYS